VHVKFSVVFGYESLLAAMFRGVEKGGAGRRLLPQLLGRWSSAVRKNAEFCKFQKLSRDYTPVPETCCFMHGSPKIMH